MWLIDQLAEQKIIEAIQRGELDNLSGEGRPVHLEDDSLVPEELRAGYRLLKNSGFLPPEVMLRKDIATLNSLLMQAISEADQQKFSKRMNYLLIQLSLTRPNSRLVTNGFYTSKLLNK